jgi:hypothetical protein
MLALFSGIFEKITKESAILINNFEGGRDEI